MQLPPFLVIIQMTTVNIVLRNELSVTYPPWLVRANEMHCPYLVLEMHIRRNIIVRRIQQHIVRKWNALARL